MADNYLDHVLQHFLSLNQAIEDVRQRIVTVSGVSYASQDARQVALVMCTHIWRFSPITGDVHMYGNNNERRTSAMGPTDSQWNNTTG